MALPWIMMIGLLAAAIWILIRSTLHWIDTMPERRRYREHHQHTTIHHPPD